MDEIKAEVIKHRNELYEMKENGVDEPLIPWYESQGIDPMAAVAVATEAGATIFMGTGGQPGIEDMMAMFAMGMQVGLRTARLVDAERFETETQAGLDELPTTDEAS